MAFTVLNTAVLDRFSRKHADARRPLASWLAVVQEAAWSNLSELRAGFPSADGITIPIGDGMSVVVTVFNIKGNHYRLISVINYEESICRVVDVLTHAD